MLSLERGNRWLIAGVTDSGKTEYLKRNVLQRCLDERRRVIALDFKDELSVKGVPRETSKVGPLPYRWTATQVATQPEVLALPNCQLSVVPDSRAAEACASAFVWLAEILEAQWQDGVRLETVLVLEETQLWSRLCQQKLIDVATAWRDYGVNVGFVTQAAVGVPKLARAQVTQIVSYCQTEPADIEALEDRTELQDPTFGQRVAQLHPKSYRFEEWHAGEPRRVSLEAPPKVQPTQHQQTGAENEQEQRRQGSDRQPLHDEQPHQEHGDGGVRDLRVLEDEGRDGSDELDVEGGRVPRGEAEGQQQVAPAVVDGRARGTPAPVNQQPKAPRRRIAPPPPTPKVRRKKRAAAQRRKHV